MIWGPPAEGPGRAPAGGPGGGAARSARAAASVGPRGRGGAASNALGPCRSRRGGEGQKGGDRLGGDIDLGEEEQELIEDRSPTD